MATYKIIRYHAFNDGRNYTVLTGLTLEEAQKHCNDKETSSRTATSKEARDYTAKRGPWFGGYTEE